MRLGLPATNPYSQRWLCHLEGNVFVGDFGAAAGVAATTASIVRWSRLIEVFAAGAGTCAAASSCSGTCCGAFGASTEHAKIVGDDFKTGAFLAFLILPFAGRDAAFDKDERALLQILLRDFRLFTPDHDLVPFGALLALAIAVFVSFIGRERKIGHGLAATGVARFGIATQTADENDFIDRHGNLLEERKIAQGERKVKSQGTLKEREELAEARAGTLTGRGREHSAQSKRVAVTSTPSSFNLARARRSSSLRGKRLMTSRSSRMPVVFWPRSRSAKPFLRRAGASLKLFG